MEKEKIIEYIESGLQRGLSLMEIEQSMLARGWSDYDIEKALDKSGLRDVESEKEELIRSERKKKEDRSIDGWEDSKLLDKNIGFLN